MVCCAALTAAWEEGGQEGPRPAFKLLPLPVASSGAAAGPALPPVLPINLQRTLLLASHVAAALFTGATGGGMGGITAAEVAVARAGLLLQLKLPSEAALRQALLMVAAPVAARAVAAARAASVGGDGQSPPAVVIAQAQHQAVVGYLANALLQSQAAAAAALAAKHAAAAAAAKQRHQASAAAIYAIAAPATAASRGSAAYLLAAPQLSPAGSSAGSADAQSQAKGRSLALGKAPADVCFACCIGVQQDGERRQLLVYASLSLRCGNQHSDWKSCSAPTNCHPALWHPCCSRWTAAVDLRGRLPPHFPPRLPAACLRWFAAAPLPRVH